MGATSAVVLLDKCETVCRRFLPWSVPRSRSASEFNQEQRLFDGDSESPAFSEDLAPSRTHIDLGVAPYPCRARSRSCDLDMMGRFVVAAEAAGIPRANIAPTYQTFGGSRWRPSDGAGDRRLPDAAEMEAMLDTWNGQVQTPEMDFAYSRGAQRDDKALERAKELQQVLLRHNQKRVGYP
jgi:hypothetical protein